MTPFIIHTMSPLLLSKPRGAAVMVFIHGGGFSSGSAMVNDWYGVPLVAVGDVIVVVINYRLGVFGKFTTKDAEAPGNIGMLDQVAALRWVKSNIQAFGGDPDRVTIFGESAGSASVSFHLLSKLSHGLFQQAIMQSGSAFSPWAFEHNPEGEIETSRKIGAAFGCDLAPYSDLVECLQRVDPGQLWTTAHQLYEGDYPITVDGTFLEDTPKHLYNKGDFKNAPIMAGINKDEGTYFLFYDYYLPYAYSQTPPPINRTTLIQYITSKLSLNGNIPPDNDILKDAVLQEYIDWSLADDPKADLFQSAVEFSGDFMIKCPVDTVTRAHVSAGDTVYKYHFTHGVTTTSYFHVVDALPFTPWLGAGHAEELLYVWGMPFIDELFTVHGHNMTEEENNLSVNFMRFWTSFAKTGNPNKSGAVKTSGEGVYSWPEYTIPELRHLVLDVELGEGRAERARQCRFWNNYLPELQLSTGSLDEAQESWRERYSTWQSHLDDWRREYELYKNDRDICS